MYVEGAGWQRGVQATTGSLCKTAMDKRVCHFYLVGTEMPSTVRQFTFISFHAAHYHLPFFKVLRTARYTALVPVAQHRSGEPEQDESHTYSV